MMRVVIRSISMTERNRRYSSLRTTVAFFSSSTASCRAEIASTSSSGLSTHLRSSRAPGAEPVLSMAPSRLPRLSRFAIDSVSSRLRLVNASIDRYFVSE